VFEGDKLMQQSIIKTTHYDMAPRSISEFCSRGREVGWGEVVLGFIC
jgi:hypothetical protein